MCEKRTRQNTIALKTTALKTTAGKKTATGRIFIFRNRISALSVSLLLVVLAFGFPLQGKTRNSGASKQPRPLPQEILNLMSEDAERQMAAMDTLRKNPKSARRNLISALRKKKLPAGWWRGVHRLTEFGMVYDIPFLIALRRRTKNPWERYIIEGAIDALYEPLEPPLKVRGLVRSFTYSNTRKPVVIKDATKGTWMLTQWSFELLHRNGFPAGLMRKLEDFKGVPHKTALELERALAKKLGWRVWLRNRDMLTLASERIPVRVALRGRARVAVRNPLKRPLLVTASLEIWYGKFRRASSPVLIYLGPRQTRTITFPVYAEGTSYRNHVRLNVRMALVNGPVIPVNRLVRIRFKTISRRSG